MRPKSVSELIECWPTIGAFADDLGCSYEAARKMRARNSITSRYWPRVIELCQSMGITNISYEWLVSVGVDDAEKVEYAQ